MCPALGEWEDCGWVWGADVPSSLSSALVGACSHLAAVAEAGTVPHGMGTLQSHGLLLAAGGWCDQLCGTALMLGCCWQCWGGGNIWEQLPVSWGESWGFPVALPVLSQLPRELRGWLILPPFQAFTRVKKAALKMWLHFWMAIRWTEQSWVCSAAAESWSLSVCSRASVSFW